MKWLWLVVSEINVSTRDDDKSIWMPKSIIVEAFDPIQALDKIRGRVIKVERLGVLTK